MTRVRRTALQRSLAISCFCTALPGLAAILSCSSDTAPVAPVTFDLVVDDVTVTTPAVTNTASVATVSCTVSARADASGGGSAKWTGGIVRTYIGSDHATATDSVVYTAANLQSAWAGATISAGQTARASWHLSESYPFSAVLDLRYQPSDSSAAEEKVSVPFACLAPGAANAAPPQVTTLSLSPFSGTVSPGSSVTVNYTASAAAGLWTTSVHMISPCDLQQSQNESLKTSATHSITFKLPLGCPLGTPFVVTATAVDGGSAEVSKDLTSPLTILDTIPPQIEMNFLRGPGFNPVPSADFFAGDSMLVIITATDNNQLSAINWTVLPSGTKGVFNATGVDDGGYLYIGVRPEWIGSIQLQFSARDAAGLVSPVLTTPADSIRVHPLVTRTSRSGVIAGATREFAVDARRSRIYVAQDEDRRIVVASLSTLQPESVIALPGVPTDVDVTPGGDSLVIAFPGLNAFGIIDLRQTTLAVTLLPVVVPDSAPEKAPLLVRSLSNGHLMAVMTNSIGKTTTALLDVDLATGVQRRRTEAAVNGTVGNYLIERSLDGSVIATSQPETSCIRRYSVSTDTFSDCIYPPRSTNGVRPTVDSTGQHIAVGLNAYDASLQLQPQGWNLVTPPAVPNTTLSADGQSLYELFNFGMVRVGTASGIMLDKSYATIGLSIPSRLSSDGTTLVTVQGSTFTTVKLH